MTHSKYHPEGNNEQTGFETPELTGSGDRMTNIISNVKKGALAATKDENKLNLSPESVNEASGIIEQVTEYLKNSRVQDAVNFIVLELDDPSNTKIYAAMNAIRNKWEGLTPSTQKIAALTVPAMGFFVKTGLLPIQGATREELRDTGKWIGPALKWGVAIGSLKWPELKELEPIIAPIIKLMDVESEILIVSYDQLQDARSERENIPEINAPSLGSDEAPAAKVKNKKAKQTEITTFI